MNSEPASPGTRAVETIFHAALALKHDARGAYLAAACADDHPLRQRVEALLLAHESPEGFLPDEPAAGPTAGLHAVVATLAGEGRAASPPALEQPGERIAEYKLLQQIGEGGCGVVYMAEQTEPVKRRVALKIIKLGMDTKQVVARFEAERQALALMDHPNIAKVLDAGATEAGRPYFVMELVRGKKITDFCDEKNLSTRDRLDLFIQVCRAVQHAHQKGIIHRDIKPANILVTVNDGVAGPKVIDFGIAKATNQQLLTDKTLFTAFEQFLGTPAYMSPEQAEMTSLDIDTRTDIYSLGVLLYELLTGKTPFDTKELLAAGLDEMRRTIREQEPPKPSTKLTQELVGANVRRPTSKSEEENGAASRRLLQMEETARLVRGDLDWIVMKCLEKDRARRYETANGLARDIERHLNSEPVVASPPRTAYRLGKFVRRNRVMVATVALVATVLVVGVIVSTWQAIRATRAERDQNRLRLQAQMAQGNEARERQKAETEAAKSKEVASLLEDMLASVGPSVARGRDTALLKEVLDKTADRIGKQLTNQPEVELELRDTLAATYGELGLYAKMEDMAETMLTIARDRFGEEHASVARALNHLGSAQRGLGMYAEAEATHRKALAMRRKLLGEESLDVAATFENLGADLLEQCLEPSGQPSFSSEKLPEAVRVLERSVAIRQKLLRQEDPQMATALINLGTALRSQGRLPEAEDLFRQALSIRRKLLGDDHPLVATSLNMLANTLAGQHKAECEDVYRQALALRQKLLGNDHPLVADSLNNLANVFAGQGKFSQAEDLYRQALAVKRHALGDAHPSVAEAVMALVVNVFLPQGKFSEAESLFDSILTPALESSPGGTELRKVRADFLVRRGCWREAAEYLSRAIQLDPTEHLLYHRLMALLAATGAAEEYHQYSQQIIAQFCGTQSGAIADRMAKDCLILPSTGAELAGACALDRVATTLNPFAPEIFWHQFRQGLAEYRQGHFASAERYAERVLNDDIRRRNEYVWVLVAESYALSALSQCQLKQLEGARANLAKGAEVLTSNVPGLKNGDPGPMWIDVLIAQTLLNEAQTLIERGSELDVSTQARNAEAAGHAKQK